MDEKSSPKEGAIISKVEKSRKAGKPKGLPKSGGRTAGTPNKKTASFSEELENKGFSLAEAIVNLFNSTTNESIKLHLIELVAKHKLPIPKQKEQEDEELEETTTTTDILKVIK